MALLLVLGLIGLHFQSVDADMKSKNGVLGGPESRDYEVLSSASSNAIIYGRPVIAIAGSGSILTRPYRFAALDGSIKDTGGIFSGTAAQGGIISYKARKGDTLSKVAADFGISVQTIIAANPEVKARALRVGQSLDILPTSGILYTAKEGETIEDVAALFKLTPQQLREFNPGIDVARFGQGTAMVIPGAHPFVDNRRDSGSSLPNLAGYFTKPTEGFNWGKLHERNAVDIAAACGTEIIAAAEGLVLEAVTDAWNSGYGHMVMIEHPNGTKTRYAHLDTVDASIGDYVEQGARIGTMGQTGEATGCHLHFEVQGAKNPFAK